MFCVGGIIEIHLLQSIVTHPPVVMVLDVGKVEEISRKLYKVLAIVHRIDILINNAGVSHRGEILTTNVQVYQDIMLVNYIGQVALIKGLSL